jgi:hypothetical protein
MLLLMSETARKMWEEETLYGEYLKVSYVTTHQQNAKSLRPMLSRRPINRLSRSAALD